MTSLIYNEKTLGYILNPVDKAIMLQHMRDTGFAIYLTDNTELLKAFDSIADHVGFECERSPQNPNTELFFNNFEPITMEELAAKAILALYVNWTPENIKIAGNPEE